MDLTGSHNINKGQHDIQLGAIKTSKAKIGGSISIELQLLTKAMYAPPSPLERASVMDVPG